MLTNNRASRNSLTNHKLHLAVLAALPLMAFTALNASAACSGDLISPTSAAITTLCTGTGTTGNLTNTASIVDTIITTTAGNNALLQFDGEGRTLNNTGDIINNRVINGTSGARGRTAVLMGAATLNAGTGTLFTTPNTPVTGATTVTLNAAAPAIYVGQTLVFGRYEAGQGDFPAGEARVITAVSGNTVTFSTPLSATYAGSGSDPIGYKVVANFGGGNNVVNNFGTISAQITAVEITQSTLGSVPSLTSVSHTAAAKGITSSVEGVYVINNKASGIIATSSAGIGAVYAIEAGGAVTDMTINNNGLLSATRTADITLANNLAISLTATSGAFSAQTLAQVNAINSQEELDSITINNGATGIIRAEGAYSGAIYNRAGEQVIVNDGLIEHVAGTPGFAIGSVSDGGEIRSLALENNGTINGDILAVNGQAQRWQVLSTEGVLDSRLNINSQWGQLDSTILNTGTIQGDLYFSNGSHELSNADGAILIGNIDIDQRDTSCGASLATNGTPNVGAFAGCNTSSAGANTVGGTVGVVSNWTVVGSKHFIFENAGDFTGDLTIRTASSNALGGLAPVETHVTLIPTITGSGSGSSLALPSHHIAGMGEDLTIDSTAGAGTVTVAPKSLATVHAGEYFLVADTLTLTGSATFPQVDSENTPLVNWNIATNMAGNLVVGVASINSASTIAGVSVRSGAAIDALMAGNSTVGGALQGLTVASEIEKTGQQLRPEANNASTQAAMSAANQVSSVIGMHQDQVRTASNGKSGVSTGEAAQGVGFWMQGFGFKGDQNQRGGVDGYSANTGGFVFGADSAIGNGDLRIGAALAYGSTTVDGQGTTTANRTNIDSYQGNVYGSWNAGTWYVDAALGYGQHQYKTKRYLALAGANMSGNHDADQYSAKIGVGYPLAIGNVTLTPLAAVSYVHLDQAGYSETDATNSGAALTIGDTKTDSFRSGLGAKVSLPLSTGTVKTALEARAIWNHEFADTNQDIAARFASGTSFTTNGVSQARDSANLGLGLSMNSANGQTLSVNYDADVRSSYFGQTASVKFRYDF